LSCWTVCPQAQQEVPPWLEECALGAHGTTGFNPQGRVFASTDSRKVPAPLVASTVHFC